MAEHLQASADHCCILVSYSLRVCEEIIVVYFLIVAGCTAIIYSAETKSLTMITWHLFDFSD
jgi:hypothetical protein